MLPPDKAQSVFFAHTIPCSISCSNSAEKPFLTLFTGITPAESPSFESCMVSYEKAGSLWALCQPWKASLHLALCTGVKWPCASPLVLGSSSRAQMMPYSSSGPKHWTQCLPLGGTQCSPGMSYYTTGCKEERMFLLVGPLKLAACPVHRGSHERACSYFVLLKNPVITKYFSACQMW